MNEKEINNIAFYLLSICFCTLGISIIIEPKAYIERMGLNVDFSGFNIPVGSGLIILGLAIAFIIRINSLKK